jgi:hypothetical protein
MLGGFQGEAWDVVGGRHRTIAYFQLTPSAEIEGKISLRFTSEARYSQFLPSETLLWPTDAVMSDGKQGTVFSKVLLMKTERRPAIN